MAAVDRRRFLKSGAATAAGAGLVTAAVGVTAPAIAQSAPDLKWRLTSSFPKSLDTIYGAADTFARRVSEMTDGWASIMNLRPPSDERCCA